MIYDFFKTVLNMSLTASFVIAVVLVARLALRRAPKWISYALWAVAGFRLVVPFTLESVLSLIPRQMPELTLPSTFIYDGQPIEPGIVAETSGRYIESGYSYAAVYNFKDIVAFIWLVGIAAMLLYAAISYIRLKRRVSLAVRIEDNIYETDRIDSPFVLGVIRPRIYVPLGMELNGYIIEHERTHIKRRDYLVAVAAFIALSLHWFNPLVWAAYFCMLRDMESSCDESVLRRYGEDIRREYSSALLKLSTKRRRLPIPLAFGEQDVKGRIKNVLNFKKHSKIIIIAAAALVVVLSVGFAVNRAGGGELDTSDWATYEFLNENYDGIFFKTGREAYNPKFVSISAQLMNIDKEHIFTCGEHFTIVKQIGAEWKVVPFTDGADVFYSIAYPLEYGSSRDYSVAPERFREPLAPGVYRVVTDVWYDDTNGRKGFTVWAEFHIDENAEIQETLTIPSDWLGNPNGEEMTVEQMKLFAERFVSLSRVMSIKSDLSEYKSFNFSSSTNAYNMEYPVEGRLVGLIVRADSDGIINRVTIRRVSDSATLEISSETYKLIDEFISGEFTPQVEPALFDVANFHRVYPSGDAWAFAWSHADNPELAAVSSVRYVPATHFDDYASLSKYVAEGDEIFRFASIFEQYDNAFFENNRLVVLYFPDYSGSITHDIGGATVNDSGTMEIAVTRFVPEEGTDDQLDRLIVIECSKAVTQSVKSYAAYIVPQNAEEIPGGMQRIFEQLAGSADYYTDGTDEFLLLRTTNFWNPYPTDISVIGTLNKHPQSVPDSFEIPVESIADSTLQPDGTTYTVYRYRMSGRGLESAELTVTFEDGTALTYHDLYADWLTAREWAKHDAEKLDEVIGEGY
ncbi:hypothetical protein FACS1894202_01680 [Clostridia bacterium]|nr:hypothetical protein FACS1894202_01680 [Clostridia bacterium]